MGNNKYDSIYKHINNIEFLKVYSGCFLTETHKLHTRRARKTALLCLYYPPYAHYSCLHCYYLLP